MKDVWFRMRRVFSAQSHAAVDQLEDPAQMLNQAQRELISSLEQARIALHQALAWRKRLQGHATQIERQVQTAAKAAQQAVAQGNEEIARKAILRRQTRAGELERIEQRLSRSEALVAKHRERLQKLSVDLRELREKRAELSHRSQFAKAVGGAACELAPGAGGERISEVVMRMEEKVNAQEAWADVALDVDDEVSDEKIDVDSFVSDLDVEAELQALKRAAAQPDIDPNNESQI